MDYILFNNGPQSHIQIIRSHTEREFVYLAESPTRYWMLKERLTAYNAEAKLMQDNRNMFNKGTQMFTTISADKFVIISTFVCAVGDPIQGVHYRPEHLGTYGPFDTRAKAIKYLDSLATDKQGVTYSVVPALGS